MSFCFKQEETEEYIQAQDAKDDEHYAEVNEMRYSQCDTEEYAEYAEPVMDVRQGYKSFDGVVRVYGVFC